MKERPILFSAPMVRAILEGRKTQTRRVAKPQPDDDARITIGEIGTSNGVAYIGNSRSGGTVDRVPCPYGQPGDRLWVRETFVLENTSEYHGDHDVPTDDRPIKKFEDGDGNWWLIPHYRATEPEPHIVPYSAALEDENDDRTRWTPAIHMPRWASRILLEITGVRIERLQDISEADALAEGIASLTGDKTVYHFDFPDPLPKWNVAGYQTAKAAYSALWESINGRDSLDANPWVWVVEFKAIKP